MLQLQCLPVGHCRQRPSALPHNRLDRDAPPHQTPPISFFGLDIPFITTHTVLWFWRLSAPRLGRFVAPVSSPKLHWGCPRSQPACRLATRRPILSKSTSSVPIQHPVRLYPIPQSHVPGEVQGTSDRIDAPRPSPLAPVFTLRQLMCCVPWSVPVVQLLQLDKSPPWPTCIFHPALLSSLSRGRSYLLIASLTQYRPV